MFLHSNVTDLVEMIFSKPPREPCTYQIYVANATPTTSDAAVAMFPFLMEILVKGAKRLYGQDITPQTLTRSQFEKLKGYIASLGYDLKHHFTQDNSIVNIWFEPLQDTRVTDCHGQTRFV